MGKLKLFILTFLITTGTVSLGIFLNRETMADKRPDIRYINHFISFSHQLKPISVPFIKENGFKVIVDIRPDGEKPNQPTSSEIEKAVTAAGLSFHYIPVPHENIPDKAVDTLASLLNEGQMKTLLYCRTGKRAVRLLALAEASRSDGPNLSEILKMVQSSRFSVEDLRGNIEARIANRTSNPDKQ